MPIGRHSDKTYLHNNVSPSLFHYQHIRTAQGLQSKSIFDTDEKKEKTKATFKEVWSRLTRAFSSVGEIITVSLTLLFFFYGLMVFLRTKYYSGVKHTEL